MAENVVQSEGPRTTLPLGDGVIAMRLEIADADVVVLGGILVGYDGLASLHAEPDAPGEIVVIAPEGRRAELEAVLADLLRELKGVQLRPDLPVRASVLG